MNYFDWSCERQASFEETLRTQEPEMEFCPICERCVESDCMVNRAIPGGEGETERMCLDCRSCR